MQRPFGYTLKFSLSLSWPWLRLGPGWAALAGALSSGYAGLNLTALIQLLSLWLLVDPILGTVWELSVQQGLWRRVVKAELPPPPRQGFSLPYAQPGSIAGRAVVLLRRYQAWWRANYRSEFGDRLTTFGLGLALALLIGLLLGPAVFWLTLLAIGLTLLAGSGSPDLAVPTGGRLQSIVQLLLPWAMGAVLWSSLTPVGLALAICYWLTYLGGLRLLGNHHRADLLFFLGQIAAILLLLALRLLPGAAIVSVCFVTQQIIKSRFDRPADFLQKVQPYLVFSLLVTGLSLGSL